jgi:hypothetical protein
MGPASTAGGQFEVKEPFFQALEHAQAIQKDCRNTLLPSAETTALEVMDQMNQYQDSGLQRLYRWTQSQCRFVYYKCTFEKPQKITRITQTYVF